MSRKDVTDHEVVRACRDRAATFADDLLAERTGQPRKVCERALERANARGLIDYGVSLRTAWPTLAGLALLASHDPQPHPFATGGIVPPGPLPITLGCDGYVVPREAFLTQADIAVTLTSANEAELLSRVRSRRGQSGTETAS